MTKKEKLQLCSMLLTGTLLLNGCSTIKNNSHNSNEVSIETNEEQEELNSSYTAVKINGNNAVLYDCSLIDSGYSYELSEDLHGYELWLVNGKKMYTPFHDTTIFTSHEDAEQYVYALLGEDANIICMNNKEHGLILKKQKIDNKNYKSHTKQQ